MTHTLKFDTDWICFREQISMSVISPLLFSTLFYLLLTLTFLFDSAIKFSVVYSKDGAELVKRLFLSRRN